MAPLLIEASLLKSFWEFRARWDTQVGFAPHTDRADLNDMRSAPSPTLCRGLPRGTLHVYMQQGLLKMTFLSIELTFLSIKLAILSSQAQEPTACSDRLQRT